MKKPTMSPHKRLVLIGKQLPGPLDSLFPLPHDHFLDMLIERSLFLGL